MNQELVHESLVAGMGYILESRRQQAAVMSTTFLRDILVRGEKSSRRGTVGKGGGGVMGCFISSIILHACSLLIRDQHGGFFGPSLCTNPFGAGNRGCVGRGGGVHE